jgi:hypothetical protein
MFRFSSWISESRGAEEVVHGVAPHLMAEAKYESPRPFAVQTVGVAKRKREEQEDAPAAQQHKQLVAKRRKAEPTAAPLNSQIPEPRCDEAPSATKMEKVEVSPAVIRDAFESQLGLEILLRHNELRVINQNLAKAQVALEQLRRCHLIPFPGAQGTSDAMLNVSAGTGPALIPRQGDIRPQWAPPYGVTDGPYSRHYAKWLIPDPSFDGVQPEWEWERSRAGRPIAEGRTTRHSTDAITPGSKARTQRGSAGQKLQALPSGYTQSKENAGPSVLKRGDGQLVKLVCLDCRRENFGSTQGFINHCRIAHRREFKSHEEAAVQSGVPIELDEVGGIVGEEKPPPPVATGLVHPLIRSASTDPAVYATVLSRINQSLNMYNQGKLPGVTSIPTSQPSTPQSVLRKSIKPNRSFVPSSEAPHLSKLLQSKGFGGNLGEIVKDAKRKIDLDDYSSHSEDSEVEKPTIRANLDGSASTPPVMRMPARAAMSPAPFARPGSSKGPKPMINTNGVSPRLPYATPINIAAAINHNRLSSHIVNDISSDDEGESDIQMLDAPSIHELSPNTSTSNNAPSLVSDDGEYDEGDADAESSIDGSERVGEDSDVAEIDIEDIDGENKAATALRHRGALRKEDKHVTFVSPVKEGTKERRSKGRSS